MYILVVLLLTSVMQSDPRVFIAEPIFVSPEISLQECQQALIKLAPEVNLDTHVLHCVKTRDLNNV
jgi:hypothetical protein